VANAAEGRIRCANPPYACYESFPICRSHVQTGCIMTYASFRSAVPPPSTSVFGRTQASGKTVACTTPAAMAGGEAPLHAYVAERTLACWRCNGSGVPPVEERTPPKRAFVVTHTALRYQAALAAGIRTIGLSTLPDSDASAASLS